MLLQTEIVNVKGIYWFTFDKFFEFLYIKQILIYYQIDFATEICKGGNENAKWKDYLEKRYLLHTQKYAFI